MAQATAVEVQEAEVIVEPKAYELPEVGMHVGTITRVESHLKVDQKTKIETPQVRIHFTLSDEKDSKGEFMKLTRTMNANLNSEKSFLSIFLRGLGIDATQRVNMAELVGMKVSINVIHNAVGPKTYANVDSVARVRTGRIAPVATEVATTEI